MRLDSEICRKIITACETQLTGTPLAGENSEGTNDPISISGLIGFPSTNQPGLAAAGGKRSRTPLDCSPL